MTRLNVVLGMGVIATALYLVGLQYESRRLFTALDKARIEGRRMEAESERLQVERRSQATPSRVERIAKDQLQMRTVTPAITAYQEAAAASAHQEVQR
jgi:cell division protein FtsL